MGVTAPLETSEDDDENVEQNSIGNEADGAESLQVGNVVVMEMNKENNGKSKKKKKRKNVNI